MLPKKILYRFTVYQVHEHDEKKPSEEDRQGFPKLSRDKPSDEICDAIPYPNG